MDKVLRVGKRAASLIARDFQIWRVQEKNNYLDRLKLFYKYAKLANDRWKSYLARSDSMSREISQQLSFLLQEGILID